MKGIMVERPDGELVRERLRALEGCSAPVSKVRAAAVEMGDELVVSLLDFFTATADEELVIEEDEELIVEEDPYYANYYETLEPVPEEEMGGEG